MSFYALTVRSFPVKVAWHGDPAIDWPATAVGMGLLSSVDEKDQRKRRIANVEAMRRYMKDVAVKDLVIKEGLDVQWFDVKALTEQQRLDFRTDALSYCGNIGNTRKEAVEDRMHLLVFNAVVTPPKIGMTDDVREAVGDLALRLSQSSISEELADDVGKSSAR